MSKQKEPLKTEQDEIEKVHPQISRTTYSDLMSEQAVLTVTIPPDGKMEEGFQKVLSNLASTSDLKLNSWADIEVLVEYDRFESIKSYYPERHGHKGPVHRPERFTEDAFKHKAYQAIRLALDAVEGLSDDCKALVLNAAAPRFVAAGMALAEARIRNDHYDDVAVRRRIREGLRRLSAEEAEKKAKAAAAVMGTMEKYVAEGKSISNAARLTFEKNGYGTSASANRQQYYRRGGRKKL